MSPLAAAIAAQLAFVLPNGETTYYAKLRSLGADAHVQSVAADVDDVSKRLGVAPSDMGALLIGENPALDPEAVSFNGTSVGMFQTNRAGRYWRAWRAACRAVPSNCRWSSALVGAYAWRDALNTCGSKARAVKFYRSGKCSGVRERDRAVVRMAARIRAHMGASHG
jgi:hypothetical protein